MNRNGFMVLLANMASYSWSHGHVYDTPAADHKLCNSMSASEQMWTVWHT
jgi:hypothetical protein